MSRPLLLLWIAIGAAVLSAVLTVVARRFALKRGMLDVPNERSSHAVPVPRTGGVAIVIATLSGAALLAWLFPADRHALLAFAGGSVLIAGVGIADDRGHVPAGIRLVAHFAAASWALYWLGGLPVLQVGDRLVDLGWTGDLLAALGIVWSINLFNFMDGIDGIAACQAASVTLGGATVMLGAGTLNGPLGLAIVLGAASLGYLPWNWSPARIFMGDVGSGFIGFGIAILALSSGPPHGLFVWWILCAVFFVDATVTLLRRLMRGERPHQAHRTHAYQHLSRRFGHARVSLGVLAVNLLVLLPLAYMAQRFPAMAWWLVAATMLPVAILALACGSGRREV